MGTKPLFNAPAPQAAAFPAAAPTSVGATAPSNPFNFQQPTAAPAAQPAAPLFSFGQRPQQQPQQQAAQPQAQSAPSQAQSQAQPTQQQEAPKPTFSFGSSAQSTAPAPTSAVQPAQQQSQSAPLFTFQAPATAPAATSTPTAVSTSLANPPNPTKPTEPALPASVSFPSSLKNKTLEEIIQAWYDELETQVSCFEKQAVEIAHWDSRIIANGEAIVALNDRVSSLELMQNQVDQNIASLAGQQSELEGLLDGMDRELPGTIQLNNGADQERTRLYESAESAQKQMIDLSSQLARLVQQLNSSDAKQPIVQVAHILNTHMDALQWIDKQLNELRQSALLTKQQADRTTTDLERLSRNTLN